MRIGPERLDQVLTGLTPTFDEANTLYLQAENRESVPAVVAGVKEVLAERHRSLEDFQVISLNSYLALVDQISDGLTAGLLAGAGLAVSTWHWLIQHNPEWASESSCSLTAPCTTAYVEEFGFVTIPWMAGSGFLLIIVLMVTGALLREEGVPR